MRWIFIWMAAANIFVISSAQAQVADCDRLAAHPNDPDRVTEGVPRKQIDLSTAIETCQDDLNAHPDNQRFAYQLGRVYFYSGDTEQALRYIGQAAAGGYRQAEFVMGALINNHRDGVAYDLCKVEDYWVRSSRKGHIAARISYVRHVTKGYFSGCKIQANPSELQAFIDINMKGSSNYLSRLLILDLQEDVEEYYQTQK